MENQQSAEIADALTPLVVRYRERCLWFLREDFVPTTVAEGLVALEHIEKHGDRNAFIEARRLRKWLLRISNASCAG